MNKTFTLRTTLVAAVLTLPLVLSAQTPAPANQTNQAAQAAKAAQAAQQAQQGQVPGLTLASAPPKAKSDQIAFMTGCWQAEASGSQVLTEAWFAPRHGIMMGMGHTVRGNNQVVMTESMRLYEEGDTLKLWMQPSGRGPLTLTLDAIGDQAAEFGIKEGELVTLISYRLKEANQLEVDFRTQRGADRRGASYQFKRIDCAPLFAPVANTPAAPAARKK